MLGAGAITTIVVILIAVILFITEWIAIDVVALLMVVALVLTGVISPEEGVAGFSNKATITVTFMFIISAALLKTGALQWLTDRLSKLFDRNYLGAMLAIMLLIAFFSAFINNTAVVAVFIPVMIQLAHQRSQPVSKFLIPLSYASIWGGSCTLIGTSTNLLVSGIAEDKGLPALSMFQLLPLGLVLLLVGALYMVVVGFRLLPNRTQAADLKTKFGLRDYITELELLPASPSIGHKIMNAAIVKEFALDIIAIRRGTAVFILPAGDFVLLSGDVLRVRCELDKLKQLAGRVKIVTAQDADITEQENIPQGSTMVEMVVSSNSDFQGKTLRELDFRRRFRAIPLAIRHRKDILYRNLYDAPLKAGDLLLAAVKTHYIKELKRQESEQESPFILLSEAMVLQFNQMKFWIVATTILAVVLSAAMGWVDIMVAAIAAVCTLVLTRCISMKDAYESVNWQVVFLMAGALSLGVAMQNTALDHFMAGQLLNVLSPLGAVAVLSGLYLLTVVLTELMSNSATAALMVPIAIAVAYEMGVEPLPFIMAVTFAAASSFVTPIGYQTNAMVFSAGQYRFADFPKVGLGLALIFWIVASLLIPIIYPIIPL